MNRPVWLAVGALGVMAVMTQLALMREMLCVFSGNELVLGVILGNWLLLTGLGASIGRTATRLRDPQLILVLLLFLVAVLPPLQIFTLRAWRNAIFIRGAAIGLPATVIATFLWLAPFCLASGYLLTLACQMTGTIGTVYVADTVGSIVGGLLFTFVLVQRLDHFALLCVPGLSCVLVAGWIRLRWVAGALAGALVVLLLLDVDGFSTARQFPGQRIVFRGNSPYGKLVVTESAGQRNYIENGVSLFSAHNTEPIEETVHYAMAQRPDAQRVLLIGGGVTGTAREILKYPNTTVTYVELDPLILQVVPVQDPRIRVVNTDGRRFIQQTSERFDVVIVDLPGPNTSQLNRFFTAEFFAELQRRLAPDGVVSFALGQYENYVGPELAQLLAAAYQTVKIRFANVRLIPGGRVYFLASDGPLSLAIARRLADAGIATQFVNRHYLDATLTPDRLNDLQRAVAQPAEINRDFKPVLYLHQLRHWLREFGGSSRWLEMALGLALVVYVMRLRAPVLVVFAGGFAAAALEIVLLLAFQILYGSVYQQLGVIVTTFMAGLAVGAWWANRRSIRLPWLAIAIAGLAAALPALVRVGWLILPVTFGLAVLVGMELPVAGRIEMSASRLFTADFVGACVGALLVSTWLIPWLGIGPACWLAAGLNCVAAGVMWRRAT